MDDIHSLMQEILRSPKYHDLGLPEQMLADLIERELAHRRSSKEALKAVRRKLHNIVAPYLEDLDYAQSRELLDKALRSEQQASLREACRQIMERHASTRERIPILGDFYQRIFAHTGVPRAILDLACGLHPFGLPWMALPPDTRYYAYDILRPRVKLIGHFFAHLAIDGRAILQDILVSPPDQPADIAFFFKEAHRFEQRRRGCNLPFWQALRVRYLLVSLPTSSLSGLHTLADRQRRLVYGAVSSQPWQVTEISFNGELVFCIDKGNENETSENSR